MSVFTQGIIHWRWLAVISVLLCGQNTVYAQGEAIPDYFNKYEHIKMKRTNDGILEVRFHTDNGPIVFTGKDHTVFVEAFFMISQDRNNKVVIFTGSGNEWFAQINLKTLGDMSNPRVWDPIIWEGQKALMNLLDISVPVIFAINGAATVHAEYILTGDFILATEDAYFQDSHLRFAGIVPGDGMHIVWPRALGRQRGWYFLYTQEKLFANEAHKLGVVSEVLPNKAALMKRSYELARKMLKIPELTRRYMRMLSTQPLKKDMLEVGAGLAFEGISAADLGIAAKERNKGTNRNVAK